MLKQKKELMVLEMAEKTVHIRGPRANTTTHFTISLELSDDASPLSYTHLAHPFVYTHLKLEIPYQPSPKTLIKAIDCTL